MAPSPGPLDVSGAEEFVWLLMGALGVAVTFILGDLVVRRVRTRFSRKGFTPPDHGV